jgi:hypothetical protein
MNHLTSHLEEALFAAKQQALSSFTRELIIVLMQGGYNVEQLIDAISDYTDRNESWNEATKYLERASAVIAKTRETKL